MPDSKPEPSHPQLPPSTDESPLLEPAVGPEAHPRRIRSGHVIGLLAVLFLSLPLAASLWWPVRPVAFPGKCPNPHPAASLVPASDPPQPPEQPARPALLPGTADPPGLAIELTARRRDIKLRTQPELEAFLVNTGAELRTVILPGDGSAYGWRTPIVRWDPPMVMRSRCGNVNGASMDHVVVLQPGERVALSWLNEPGFEERGTYAVSLELEHDPELEWAGVGDHPPDVMERIRSVPAYRVRSNVIEMRVE